MEEREDIRKERKVFRITPPYISVSEEKVQIDMEETMILLRELEAIMAVVLVVLALRIGMVVLVAEVLHILPRQKEEY